jgi:hypothetical protein
LQRIAKITGMTNSALQLQSIKKNKKMNKTRCFSTLKKMVSCFSLFALCVMPDAYARDGVGIGIIAGEPSGVSMKYWLDDTTAIDAALAISLSDHNPFQFHADYLIHSSSSAIRTAEVKGKMPWYYGVGGRISTHHDETQLGIRIPLGITYLFSDVPMDLFAEIAPVLDVTPDLNLDLSGAIGLRYYFH